MNAMLAVLSQTALPMDTPTDRPTDTSTDTPTDPSGRGRARRMPVRRRDPRGRAALPERSARVRLPTRSRCADGAEAYDVDVFARRLAAAFDGIQARTLGPEADGQPGIRPGDVVLVDRQGSTASIGVERREATLGQVFAVIRRLPTESAPQTDGHA